MKTCLMPSPHKPLPLGGLARPLRLKISGEKIFRLLQTEKLHVEDLQCLDERSQGLLKQLLLRCCLTATGRCDE